MSAIKCTPLSPVFGARIEGLDTAKRASNEEASAVRAALKEHKLVVIPGGRLSVSQLAAFGKSLNLGDTETFGAKQLVSSYLSGFPEEPSVLQLEYGPEVAPADINVWHQDHSWRKEVTTYELSYADLTPAVGGDVMYADATKAYSTLSTPIKALIEGTTSLCVLARGYQNLEVCGKKYAETLIKHPPIHQPVVGFDSETGEKWLNVNAGYSFRIPDLTPAESEAILPMLCQHVTKPEHCLRLSYTVGDIVIFDNHRLQHYAVSDYYPAPRRIRRMSFHAQEIRGVEDARNVSSAVQITEEKKEEAAAVTSRVPRLGSVGQEVADLATHLAAGLRLLSTGNQADLCAGFFSARVSSKPDLFLAPSHGTHWDEATPNTFGVFRTSRRTEKSSSSAGGGFHERIAGEGPMPNFPSTAVSAAIYAAFPETKAIVHAHPRSIMSLAALDASGVGKVLPISEPSFMFFERVSYLPCNFFFDDDYLEQIVEALQKKDGHEESPFCIIMRNHSYLMVGRTLQECYLRCYMLEQSASIQLAVLSANGGKLPPIPDRKECLFHRRSYEGYNGCAPYNGELEWPGLVRGLERAHPGWSDDHGAKLGGTFERCLLEISQVKVNL